MGGSICSGYHLTMLQSAEPSSCSCGLCLITRRSCHVILCSLPKVPFQSSSVCDTLDSLGTQLMLLLSQSSRTLWGYFLTICLNALGSHSYSTDIHLIQEKAHSSPLPHPPPLILVGYELRAQALFIKKLLLGWHALCQIVSTEEVNGRPGPAKNCRLPLQA